MANLHWTQTQAQAEATSGAPRASQSFWFAMSLGLVGIIVGFMIGSVQKSAPVGANAVVAKPSSSVAAQKPTPAPAGNLPGVDLATEHVRGSKNATVAIVEYSDFQCPFCKRVHPTLEQVLQKNANDVAWVYRQFPLSFHPYAQLLAEGSECAAELGGNDAFWTYGDAVYSTVDFNGTVPVKDQLAALTGSIGIDKQSFVSCLENGKYTQKVKAQQDAGAAAGVSGTPASYVINLKTKRSVFVSGAQPLEAFQSAIDSVR